MAKMQRSLGAPQFSQRYAAPFRAPHVLKARSVTITQGWRGLVSYICLNM